MFEAVEPFNFHPTSSLYIYKVFEHLLLWWMGIWMYTTTIASVGHDRIRVLTAGSRFPIIGDRFGTDNLAGGAVNSFTCWMDGAQLHHLREEPMAHAEVLLDQDGSMKWCGKRSGHSCLPTSFTLQCSS